MSAEVLVAAEEALARFGVKYAFDDEHAHQVARLVGQLAERLTPIHALGEEDLILLRHAALVHDVGYFVARRGHHRHSAYLIGSDELLGDYPRAARERVALLAHAHRKRLPDLPKWWGRGETTRFEHAAALLRVADGLDYLHNGAATVIACHIGRQAVVVEVEGLGLTEVGQALRRKARLFARVFEREASFVAAVRPPAGMLP